MQVKALPSFEAHSISGSGATGMPQEGHLTIAEVSVMLETAMTRLTAGRQQVVDVPSDARLVIITAVL